MADKNDHRSPETRQDKQLAEEVVRYQKDPVGRTITKAARLLASPRAQKAIDAGIEGVKAGYEPEKYSRGGKIKPTKYC